MTSCDMLIIRDMLLELSAKIVLCNPFEDVEQTNASARTNALVEWHDPKLPATCMPFQHQISLLPNDVEGVCLSQQLFPGLWMLRRTISHRCCRHRSCAFATGGWSWAAVWMPTFDI